jgi:adenosylhomocysteinase
LQMKNGSILANAGHFNVEISIDALKSNSISVKQVNENTTEYEIKKGTKLYLIGEGRLVNLVAAEGHPSEVMDMSFANQLLSSIKLIQSKGSLSPAVYEIERSQDQEIARAKLESMDINIDILTEEQNTYLTGFSEGT